LTDEHKLSRDIGRQAQAKALLDNLLLQEAFEHIDRSYIEAWRSAIDPAAREQLWLAQSNLRKVRGHLTRVLSDGKLAQREIDQLTEKRKRFGIV
jgi:hypothetical protein